MGDLEECLSCKHSRPREPRTREHVKAVLASGPQDQTKGNSGSHLEETRRPLFDLRCFAEYLSSSPARPRRANKDASDLELPESGESRSPGITTAPSMATILDLPNEILDKVFNHLAWTPEESLTPSCPDITNISESCRTLRDAILPTLFRNVRLKLRWIDGAIAEPGLYRLRHEAPEIAKLIRCVHIETEFGTTTRPGNPFTIPLALDDWIGPPASDAATELQINHRQRICEIAAELYGASLPLGSSTQSPYTTDEIARAFFGARESEAYHEIIQSDEIGPRQASVGNEASYYPGLGDAPEGNADSELGARRKEARRRRLQLDALITCMVSLPPQTHSLIFEAVPLDTHDQLQHAFALQVCAMAIRIFANRLQSLTMISRSLGASRRGLPPADVADPGEEYDSTLTPVISELHTLTSLTLASTTGISDRLSKHSLDAIRATNWQVEPLCSNITHFTLCNITDKRSRFFDLIKSFTSLTDLTISGVKLGPDWTAQGLAPGLATRATMSRDGDPLWLLFLISIRLHRADLRIHLGDLCQWHAPATLPESAVKWLQEEAVPVRANVDFERETRLTEDFSSFMVLWVMDDSDRGELAREDANIGRLVDDAFSSRWRTFANLR